MNQFTKNILLATCLVPTISFAQTSSAFMQLKSYVEMANYYQEEIQLNSIMINNLRDKVEAFCEDQTTQVCSIDEALDVIVTQEMINAGFALAPRGSTFSVPANSLSFEELSNDMFDYKVTLDLGTLYNDSDFANEIQTFKWDTNGTVKSVSYNYGDYSENFILKNGEMSLNGTMRDETESNSNYSINLQQYDTVDNGIEAKVVFTSPDIGVTYNMLAKVDNNGGFMESTINISGMETQYNETFDKDGTLTGQKVKSATTYGEWIEIMPIDEDVYSEYLDLDESNITSSNVSINIDNPQYHSQFSTYIVVSKDVIPNLEDGSILGFGDYYDSNNNSSIEKDELTFEYFGLDDSLGSSTVTDDDSLDIYMVSINEQGSENFEKVEGIWFTK